MEARSGKVTAIVVMLFAYTGMAYACDGGGIKRCTIDFQAKVNGVMKFDVIMGWPTKVCRWVEDYASCVQPHLTGCPTNVVSPLQNTLNVFKKPPFNCDVSVIGSGGVAMTTKSPAMHGVTMATSLMGFGHSCTTREHLEILECADRFSELKLKSIIASSSDPRSQACRLANDFAGCMRPYLGSCSASDIAALNRWIRIELDEYNGPRLNCGVSLMDGSRVVPGGRPKLPDRRGGSPDIPYRHMGWGDRTTAFRIVHLEATTRGVFNGAGRTMVGGLTLPMGLLAAVISLRFI